MEIFNILDALLETLDVPFYDTMPEFAENQMPELMVVYSLYDTPKLHGEGRLISVEYIVTVNVIGTDVKEVDELQKSLFELMQDNGFSYAGCSYQMDSDYPKYYRRIIDFKYYL